jgi:hypothetical protein
VSCGGWSNTDLRSFFMASFVHKLACARALSCKRRPSSIFLCSRIRCIRSLNFCRIPTYTSELMVVLHNVNQNHLGVKAKVGRPLHGSS